MEQETDWQHKKQSIFHNKIDAILGCWDIVTFKKRVRSRDQWSSSPRNTSHSSSAGSPAGLDDLDGQSNKNEQSQGDLKKKDAGNARKKQSQQLMKRNRAAIEQGEEEERRELRGSMNTKTTDGYDGSIYCGYDPFCEQQHWIISSHMNG